MTRFALIPLAFFANACASAEDVQDTVTDETEQVRAAFDEVDGQLDRPTSTYGNRIARISARMFADDLNEAGCRQVGAVAGGWSDRTFRTALNVFTAQGDHAVRLHGGLTWDDNASGQLFAKGANPEENMVMAIEADWMGDKVDGDVFMGNGNGPEYRLFAEKRSRGLGGVVIGAIGYCKR